jgi:hypothetical protein
MRMMTWAMLGVVCCALPGLTQERPEESIKNAMAAAGGVDVLNKYPAGRSIGKGIMFHGGNETPFGFEQAYEIPGRFRTVIRCEVKGQPWELIQVVRDGVARQTINGRTIPLTDAAMKQLQLAALLNEVAHLTPLSDRKFTLKPARQIKGVDRLGLQVQAKGYPDLLLSFDRKTGLLQRVEYRDIDLETAREGEAEIVLEAYKEVAGLHRPTRSTLLRDGKKVVEMTVEKFTPLEKIEPRAFTIDE